MNRKNGLIRWLSGGAVVALLAVLLGYSQASHILASGAGRIGFGAVGHWVVCDAVSRLRSPEVARERARFAAAWMLGSVNATEPQQETVNVVLDALVADLADLDSRHQQHRQAFKAQLTQPGIDRVALEEIRRNEIELLDATSKRLVEGLADISETLSPDQRRELFGSGGRPRH